MMNKKYEYVFYCSKCKVDHGGECPPEMVIVSVPLSTPRKTIIIPNLLSNTGTVNLNTGRPVIGLIYMSETRQDANAAWKYSNGNFEVMSVGSDGMVEIKHAYSSNRFQYHQDHWDVAGMRSPHSTAQLRFVLIP